MKSYSPDKYMYFNVFTFVFMLLKHYHVISFDPTNNTDWYVEESHFPGEGSEASVLLGLCCSTHSSSWPVPRARSPSRVLKHKATYQCFFVFGAVPRSIKPLTRELNMRVGEI